MDISWLRTFVAAAKSGSFRAAADTLHLAQPTVSVQIQKLESFWEVQLFERIGRNVGLSQAGKRFLEHAQAILNKYDESLQDMARWREGYEQLITVAASPIVATTFLPRWIRAFSIKHPEVAFTVRVMDSSELSHTVASLEADIGFSRILTQDSKLDCQIVYDDPLVFAAPLDSQDFEGSPRYIEDVLRQYTLLTHNHEGYWDDILTTLRVQYSAIRTMAVSQVHVCLDWILEGMGVSFLPVSTVTRAVAVGAIEVIPFELFPLPMTHTYMVSHRHRTGISEEFAQFVKEYMDVRPLG